MPPHQHRPSAHSLLVVRLAPLFVFLTATALARADESVLCDPRQPAPACKPMPPGSPRQLTPQEIDAIRARTVADYAAQNAPRIYEDAQASRDQARYQAWVSRVEDARPPDIEVRYPTIETGVGMRYGMGLRKGYGHAGPEVNVGFRFDRMFSIDVPVALLESWAGRLGTWQTIGTSPAFVVAWATKDAFLYARAGADLLIPTGAPANVTPDLMIGGHIGFGTLFFATSLPNWGYVGIGYDLRFSLRGGVGGGGPAFDGVRPGLDGSLYLRFGF